jgi:hypothetical protein
LIFQGQNLTVADLNGDGFRDFVTWRQNIQGLGLDTVFVYFGSVGGIDTIADLKLVGENTGDGFGNAIAVGDVNGDHVDDLVIGAWSYPSSVVGRGKIYLYCGSNPFEGVLTMSFVGDTDNVFLGLDCKIADVNGDGISDLLVRGVDARTPGQNSLTFDYLNVYFGSASLDSISDYRIEGRKGRQLGAFQVMDANGDDRKDILWIFGDSTADRIGVFLGGSSLNSTPDFTITPPAFFSLEIARIVDAGDMDGDGYHDIAVGDLYASQGGGFVLIYRGGSALDTLWDAGRGRADGSWFGAAIDTIGDINGDGLTDIIVGGPHYHFGTLQGYFGVFMGDKRITSVAERVNTGLPRLALLRQNYPNPFNPSTTISYTLPTQSFVALKVFNVLGQEVATLVNGIESPGSKSVRFDAGDLPSGVYFYRLQEGSYSSTKMLMVVK